MGAVKIQEYEKVQCFTKRLSVVCLCFITNSPASHCIPVHPTSQVQVLGAVQFPPFWQGLVQMAAVGEADMIVHEQTKIKQNHKNANINNTRYNSKQTYDCTEAHSHSTVHQTGRFYCLIPAVCSLHHRCRSLQSCRLYWRDCVDHLWEYQDHCSQWL